MATGYLMGVIRITNLFIAIFILLYAYLFLMKSSRRKDRRPWEYLFFSAFIFMLYQIFMLVVFFSEPTTFVTDRTVIGALVEFLYSGLVLLAFVSQHDLLLNTPLILISRKLRDEKAKANAEKEKK